MRKERKVFTGLLNAARIRHDVTSIVKGLGGVFDTLPLQRRVSFLPRQSLSGVKAGVKEMIG
jgi:hypothetical protein